MPKSNIQRGPLRFSRSCYKHLAGQLGVEITRALLNHDYIQLADNRQFMVTMAGAKWFKNIGIDTATIKPTRNGLARQCTDGSEHIPHLAGPLGAELLSVLCANDWVRRTADTRLITVTPAGWTQFNQLLGVTEESVRISTE